MASCNLTVDLVSVPGALVTVTYDRDVRTSTGVIPSGAAVGRGVHQSGAPVVVSVLQNDDPSVSAESQGFATVVRAKWFDASSRRDVSDSWTVAVGSAQGAAVNLSALAPTVQVAPSTITVSPAQINQASTDASNALATANDAESKVNAAVASQDSATAQNINTGTNTAAALASREQREGIIIPNTASHADVQSALTSAASLGLKVTIAGSYTTDQTLLIGGNCDLTGLKITYTGTGTAVQVGSSATGQLQYLHIGLPTVIDGTKPATPGVWSNTTGIQVRNTFRSVFTVPKILNFGIGLQLFGDASYGFGGTSYCTFNIIALSNNLVNQDHNYTIGTPNGWVTQCTFIGGSWAHSEGSTPQPGMRHVRALQGSNHTWVGSCFEGQREEYVIDYNGTDSLFLNCRYEFAGTGAAPMKWGPLTARNIMVGGYQVGQLVHTISAGGNQPQILGGNVNMQSFTNTMGMTLWSAGGATGLLTTMSSGWQAAGYTPAANYVFTLLQTGPSLKAPTDSAATPRWAVNYSAKTMTLGAGTNASASLVAWNNGSPEGVTTAAPGSTYYNYNAGGSGFGQYMKGSGAGNTGWQATGFQPFATTARPSATLAGIGGTYYDTTLNKPAWSDGTTWRDATGAAI